MNPETGENTGAQEDTRTEKEKIIDLLVFKYDGLSSDEAEVVIASGWYEVIERYENGDPKTVALKDVPQEQLNAFDLTPDAEKLVWEEFSAKIKEEAEEEADVGGILLEPLFGLVNFIADSLIGILGELMAPETSTMKVLQDNAIPVASGVTEFIDVNTESFIGKIKYPSIEYTPEEIFAGKIDLLSIDFISGKNYEGNENTNKDWINIRKVISQWYQVLRMIAIIGLLSVLIYTGIKIIISANAKDKAKYKEWIINWFMAAAILFSMHIIMAFIISVTGEFSKLISESSQTINVRTPEKTFATNLMGLVRFRIQSNDFGQKVGYEVMYIALIVYTIKFTFIYLKRVLNMAFLTLIAPIVALTYPIDKINDGRAQGFDMWIKEYIFNALLQPMHLVLYYVLVGSAITIAASNPIYGIVVLMFMTEAEKLLKKIFGFDKAGGGTVGGMAGAFAAGAIASNIKNIANLAKGNGGKGGSGGSDKQVPELDNPKATERPSMDAFNDFNQQDEENSGVNNSRNASTGNSSAANAFQNSEDPVADSEREALEEQLADGQISENELTAEQRAMLGMPPVEQPGQQSGDAQDSQQSEQQPNESPAPSEGAEEPEQLSEQQPTRKPIRQMAAEKMERLKNTNQYKGATAVVKKLAKPVWDADKSKKENFKRLGRKIGKGVLKTGAGLALGVTAAAVQAGISITDGKYSAMEGLATFGAGMTGGRRVGDRIASGFGELRDAYKEGAMPIDSKERKAEIMRKAQERFADRDDVIAFNKKNYPGGEQKAMERQRDIYLPAGITDLKDMKSGITYANELAKQGMSQPQADKRAAATIDFKKKLEKQGQLQAIRDKDKQNAYINSMVAQASDADKAKVRKQYENAFKSIIAFDMANNQ